MHSNIKRGDIQNYKYIISKWIISFISYNTEILSLLLSKFKHNVKMNGDA